jgi:hypothetical protein
VAPRAAPTPAAAMGPAPDGVSHTYSTAEKIQAALEEGAWRQGVGEEEADVLCAVGLQLLGRSHPYSMDLPAVGQLRIAVQPAEWCAVCCAWRACVARCACVAKRRALHAVSACWAPCAVLCCVACAVLFGLC